MSRNGGRKVPAGNSVFRGPRTPHESGADARSALTPARGALVLAGVGLLLILVVAQSALSGLARVGHQDHEASAVSKIVQAQQNADQEHDALHADITQLLTGAVATAESRVAVLQDTARYRADLQRLDTARVPDAVQRQMLAVTAQERQYVTTAEQLAGAASPPAGAVQSLQDFDRSFSSLVAPMAALTDRLAGLEATASASSSRAREAAVHRVVAAAAVAVLTLLGLSWWLSRMGRRLAHAGTQKGFSSTLQHSLLPVALPAHPGVQCAARYLPTAAGADVGGDWYDAFPLPGGDLALVIGDVAGHDMQAAGVMGKMRSALRAYALDGHRPSDVLAKLNHFTIAMHPAVMTTCIYAVYSADTRTLTWANAGHYSPLLVTADGAEYLATQGARPPIGAQAETSYIDMVQPIPPRSHLLMFTDGLIERRGHDIDDGLHALAATGTRALALAVAGAEELCAAVLAVFLPQGTADDDVALLAITTDPEPASRQAELRR